MIKGSNMVEEEQISKISSVTLQKCLESDCHYGTTSKNHNYSKMSSFVYERKNGIYIFDLNKTIEKMKEVYKEVYNLTKNGGKIIFVANKNTRAKEEIKNDAIRSGSFFVINRWLGGTFTNFSSIKMAIRKLKMMEKSEEDGSIKNLKKKEQVLFFRNKQKMLKNLEGIKEMIKIPQAVFVTNSNQKDLKVIKEARDKGIKIFAIVNTNNNPDIVDYFIPASNSSSKSIKFISNLIADAIVEAKCGIEIEKNDKFKKDPNDISMKEVIKNVEKKIAEKISAIRAAKEKKQDLFIKKMQFKKDLFERKKREISESENSSKNEKNVLSNQEQLSVKKNDNKEEKLDDNKKEEKKVKEKTKEEKKIKIKSSKNKKIVNKSKDTKIKKENDENIKKEDNKSVAKAKIKKHKKIENKKG